MGAGGAVPCTKWRTGGAVRPAVGDCAALELIVPKGNVGKALVSGDGMHWQFKLGEKADKQGGRDILVSMNRAPELPTLTNSGMIRPLLYAGVNSFERWEDYNFKFRVQRRYHCEAMSD